MDEEIKICGNHKDKRGWMGFQASELLYPGYCCSLSAQEAARIQIITLTVLHCMDDG